MSESDKWKEFWGQLIGSDDAPSVRFQQLLTSIAAFIRKSVAPIGDASLSPAKLAAFYRLCGHNFDALFLHPSSSALSSIYQTIQCFHSLQPTLDPSAAPSIPTLTTEGFIRWETVQLLLEPQTHVPILQRAVQQFELLLPDSHQKFPDTLPSACLPSQPSPELTKWHDQQLQDWTASKTQKEKINISNFDDDSIDQRRRRKDARSTHEDVNEASPDIRGGWRYITSPPPRSREQLRSRRSPLSFGSAGLSPNRHRASDERRFYPDPFPDGPTPRSTKQSPGFVSEQHSNGGRSKLSHPADFSRRTPTQGLTPNSADSDSRFSRRHSSAQLYENPYLGPQSVDRDSETGSVGNAQSKARSLSRRPKSPMMPEISPTQRKRSTSRSSRPPPLHTNSRTRSVSHSSILNNNSVEQPGSQSFAQDSTAQDFANPYRSNETARPQLGNLPKSKSGRGRRALVESEEVG